MRRDFFVCPQGRLHTWDVTVTHVLFTWSAPMSMEPLLFCPDTDRGLHRDSLHMMYEKYFTGSPCLRSSFSYLGQVCVVSCLACTGDADSRDRAMIEVRMRLRMVVLS